MNIAFNEISIRPFAESPHTLKVHFINLGKTVKALKTNYNISHLIFPSNLAEIEVLPELSIHQWLEDLNGLEKQQIMSLISKKPFSNDFLDGSEVDIDSYVFSNIELGIDEDICTGLGLAHLYQTSTISLNTDIFWKNDRILLNILDYTTEERTSVSVSNCCLEELTEDFRTWLVENAEVVLVTTDLEPSDKLIHLRDDHGKDILDTFAKKLRNSNYVVSIINSLPFNSNTSRFIRKCYSDGKVEIVLHWEDQGIGMIVQTTGRTYHETIAIAELLKDKYDR